MESWEEGDASVGMMELAPGKPEEEERLAVDRLEDSTLCFAEDCTEQSEASSSKSAVKYALRRRRFRLCQESISSAVHEILSDKKRVTHHHSLHQAYQVTDDQHHSEQDGGGGETEEEGEEEGEGEEEEEEDLAWSQALMALFQYYSGYGQDKGMLEDRKEMHLYEFEKFTRDIGLVHRPMPVLASVQHLEDIDLLGARVGPGDVVLAFERQVHKKTRSKVVHFKGFVSAMVELSFLRFGGTWYEQQHAATEDREERIVRGKEKGTYRANIVAMIWCFKTFLRELVIRRGFQAWEAANREQENKCKVVSLPETAKSEHSKFLSLLFRHYTAESNGKMGFDCFVQFTKEFELFPQLCSRRAIARCFRSTFVVAHAESSKQKLVLTQDLFQPCLVILSQEIFDHVYCELELRDVQASFEKLVDLLRSCKSLVYRIEAEERARSKRKRMADEQRKMRELVKAKHATSGQEGNARKQQHQREQLEEEKRHTKPSRRRCVSSKDGLRRKRKSNATSNSLNSKLEALSLNMDAFVNQHRYAGTEKSFSPSKPGTPNHHITIHPDGTIDV